MSRRKRARTALAIILLETSAIPMGLTPGHLFSGIRQQATKALRLSGWMVEVQILWPIAARAWHKS